MEENTNSAKDSKGETTPRTISRKKIITFAVIILIAAAVGYIHYKYVSHLFENHRNFSYLSELERDMSFQTEMGFYYSYFRTVIEEKPFFSAISKLMYDKLVEYPKDVNAFNRFNIHPEVMIGALYRYFEPWLNTTAYRQCHLVNRGEDMSPVESCVGLGQPVFFYLEAIWWLAGLTVTALFLHATILSESILGGILAVASYFANHAECTRVQWAPNERENMAAPLLFLQAWLLTLQLRDKGGRTTIHLQVSVLILNCLCLQFWQFSQFIFLTQIAIFFIMEQLKIIELKSLCIFLHSHFCGLHMAVLLLQGNEMLNSSLYASLFLVVSAYSLFFSSLRVKVQNRFDLFVESWLVILRIALVICASFYLKKIISNFLQVEEDTHIWDLLYSKFTDFQSFHTLLYTCSDVFDYLPLNTIKKLFHSFLIPFVLISIFNVCAYWLSNAIRDYQRMKEAENKSKALKKESPTVQDDEDSGIENNADTKVRKRKVDGLSKDLDVIDKGLKEEKTKDKVIYFLSHLKLDPAIFYNISQMVVYGVMAALVMRLKLLFVTQMCVVSSLMMNTRYYLFPKSFMKYIPLFWILSMTPLVKDLVHNISHELAHIGEFSDLAQEQLLEWIKAETSMGSAFAGSMPILATVMLATRRPVVAHPHYEHLEARQRAYSVYKTYGRFLSSELYEELTKLKATYLIVETKYCYGRSNKGCSLGDIWDIERPWPYTLPRLCHTLLSDHVEHFYPLYRNEEYAVFKIHDYSVRYMPRSFDT